MRRLFAILAVIAVATALAGCESFHGKSPFETSLPSSMLGLRVTDGQLRIWTGSPCEGTTQVVVRFAYPGEERAELRLYTPRYAGEDGLTPGVEFEHFTLGGPYPGFNVKEPLALGFDWRTAQRFVFEVAGPPIARGIAGIDFAPIATEITEHSVDHPKDTYYFPDLGWLNPAEVAAKNGKEFLTVCTPDPGRGEGETRTVGVRVTDDTLRFWTGSPCPVDGVILTFQPGQAETILHQDFPHTGVEYLTFGESTPQFTVTHPLPPDFDWRTAKSVLFRLIDKKGLLVTNNSMAWSRTTQLTNLIAESSQHPPDTYYFEGHGWLNPAEVAARDGTSMETICGK